MTGKKIILAGGTGFIGQELCNYFGHTNEMIVLTRQMRTTKNNAGINLLQDAVRKNIHYVQWNGTSTGEWVNALNGADAVINLAGQTVNCRYTAPNKQAILDSRVQPTHAIGWAIQQVTHPPALWINAASATIYRDARDHPQDEYTGEMGHGFSVQVCRQWEQAFFEQVTPGTRKVALRMAITLGAGGVMRPYFNLLKYGLGGCQGSGKQMYSWIHIEDTCRIIEWVAAHSTLEGVYNCCSPNPLINKVFMQTLRETTGNWIGLPIPQWMLNIGAAMIGTETELVLKSRWVIPAKILESGFSFKYPLLKDAFQDIISHTPKRDYRLF